MISPRKKPSPPSLASLFLRSDIQKEGDRILLPYLTTQSRLRLSECCRETRPYRDYLSRVRIVKRGEQSPAASRAFAQWILQWKPGYLQHLEVWDSSITIIGLATHGGFEGLKSLHVMEMEQNHSYAFLQALSAKAFVNLEELHISINAEGGSQEEDPIVFEICTELGVGACPKLQRLCIETESDSCATYMPMDEETIRSGAFDNLEVLDFTGNYCVFDGIETRKYHNLKQLSVRCPVKIQEFDQHLGHALASGCFPNLQGIDIQNVCLNAVLRTLQEGLRRSTLPQVRKLTVSCCTCCTLFEGDDEVYDIRLYNAFKQEFPYISLRREA